MTEAISFSDHVRVVTTPVTTELGIAGLVGTVYGYTTPSASGVEVVGVLTSDYAINVHFDDRDESLWLAPELLEFVNHAPGTEIKLSGVPKKWIREADGSWREEPLESAAGRPSNQSASAEPGERSTRKWWKLW